MYYGWLVVAASTVIYMVFLGAIYSSYGLFVMPVSEELGLSRADANTGLVILSLGTAVQAPFLGRLVDKWSVRRVMALGAVVFAATYAVIATSHSLWLNAAILALLFPIAAQGACSLPAPLLIARWFKVHRGRAMAMAHLGLSLGGVVVPPIVAALIESFGWRAALTITGAGAGATLLAIALVVREWPGPGDREGGAEARDPDGGADASPQPVAAIRKRRRHRVHRGRSHPLLVVPGEGVRPMAVGDVRGEAAPGGRETLRAESCRHVPHPTRTALVRDGRYFSDIVRTVAARKIRSGDSRGTTVRPSHIIPETLMTPDRPSRRVRALYSSRL